MDRMVGVVMMVAMVTVVMVVMVAMGDRSSLVVGHFPAMSRFRSVYDVIKRNRYGYIHICISFVTSFEKKTY